MLVVLTMFLLLCGGGNCNRLLIPDQDLQPQLKTCVGFILNKYFGDAKKLTVFDLTFSDDTLLLYVNSLQILSVSIRRFAQNIARNNLYYMIVALNAYEFRRVINTISKEDTWDPYVRYLVVVRSLQNNTDLQLVFNTLLQSHIYNVVVLNGTETAELYTYNPFENYACGKFYTRLFEFGKCSDAAAVDLYPYKTTTGLRNCVLRVSCPEWAPYSIEPSQSDDHPYEMGIDQYIFHLMSEIEHFQYDFIYNYDPEMFSTVTQSQHGVLLTGPLQMLQRNLTDVMLGGLVLTQTRAKTLFYVHGHLDQIEEIRYVVKKAGNTPPWKSFYIEFSPLVWLLLLLVFVFYTFILIFLLRAQDKSIMVLVLLDSLLLHGSKIKARQTVNVVFIIWVWFAYLINCFYQSSLMSLTTKPSLEYQIDDFKALQAHNLKPCLSSIMQGVISIDTVFDYMPPQNDTQDESCGRFISSLRTVGNSYEMYTVVLHTVLLYYEHLLYDEYGTSLIHVFSRPSTKVNYAIYFYKGFPLTQRFHDIALRIRETGLSDRSLKKHFNLRKIKYHYRVRGFKARFAIPWYVYIYGLIISSLTFVIEIVLKKVGM